MKIKIHYTSFNLRKSTESVPYTPRRQLFFEEMDIPYKIESRASDIPPYKQNWIDWDEDYNDVYVDLSSIEEIQEFAARYGSKIVISEHNIILEFLPERMKVVKHNRG